MVDRKRNLVKALLFFLAFSFTVIWASPGVTAQAASQVKLNVSKKVLCPKTTLNLKVLKTTKKPVWKSTKASVASVNSSGKVTAKKAGSAVITAKIGKKTYRCKITVKNHSYKKATCTKAKICSRCKKKSGKALGHSYQKATCTKARTCRRCGKTAGKALGHDYQEATCTQPAICRRCGAAAGSALGHDYQEATCTQPAICRRCGASMGSALGHDYQEATCTQPAICRRCGASMGNALGHDYQEATCTQPKTCRRCRETVGEALGHLYKDSVVAAGKTGQGYTWHECSRCGDGYKDAYTDFQPEAEQVYRDMIALMETYPEGMSWTNDNYYHSDVLGGGYGCAGFAYALSDEAFGYLPGKKHTDFSNLKVGDILRINGNTHSVIILEVNASGVVLAEGNMNSSVHWGRTMSFDEIQQTGDYVLTRYP